MAKKTKRNEPKSGAGKKVRVASIVTLSDASKKSSEQLKSSAVNKRVSKDLKTLRKYYSDAVG